MDDYYCQWCEEVRAVNHLVPVDENLFLEPKIVLNWCSDRKPTLPIKLLMLLGEGLLAEEG